LDALIVLKIWDVLKEKKEDTKEIIGKEEVNKVEAEQRVEANF
jgi:hypothetical protein